MRFENLGTSAARNITVEYRWYEGRLERAEELASEIIQSKPDVVVTVGPQGAWAAKALIHTLPVVFAAISDPVGYGLVASLARPGGNKTGFSFDPSPQLATKGVELLREAYPSISRLAILANPDSKRYLEHAHQSARALMISVQDFPVRGEGDLSAAFDAIGAHRSDAIFVVPDPVTLVHHRRIVDFVAHMQRPALYMVRLFVDAGGLMSYGPSLRAQLRGAAGYVDRILKGARPGELPVEQPSEFELVINLKAARALGLTISPSLLLRADHVIE